jgi:DNA-binding MarR family transcriptional regulator
MTSDEPHVMLALGNLMAESRALVLTEGERGLRPSHHRVIAHVPPEGITVTDLAERVGMTKQGIGQFVTQLTESGHLAVTLNPEDRRIRVVRRTAKGNAAARRLAGLMDGLEQTWADRVGERRYAEFRAILDDIAAGLPISQ